LSAEDERYMQMALKLAKRGVGGVEPNPIVGCVIVKRERVIGQGWHKEFGGPHAEIMALEDCKKLKVSPRDGTMYVTLEPCCHEAKTGPCTEAIIDAGLRKAVVATIDPSAYASGKGIDLLREAGIEVQTGVCEREAKFLNAPFIKFATTGKCWVVLKWAQSLDGKLAYAEKTDQDQWISNEQSRKDAHKLRRRAQAILVGINTVIADNPLLMPRPSKGKKPIRIVLDNSLRIPIKCKLMRTTKKGRVIVCTSESAIRANPKVAERIKKKGVEVLVYPDVEGRSNLHFLLDEISRRDVQQLLVEGGPSVLASFLVEQLADEVCVYIAPKIFGSGGSAEISQSLAELAAVVGLEHVDIKRIGDDVRLTGLTRKALSEVSVVE